MFEDEGEKHGGSLDPFDDRPTAVRGFYSLTENSSGIGAKERSDVRS
jgi:hypothetical protein